MPFFLIPTALGVSFCLIWVFIGGMIFRDSQIAAQQDLDSSVSILPLTIPRVAKRPIPSQKSRKHRRKAVRFAS